MFQDINVAKSAPSAPLTIYQKSMYPPKVGKKPPFRQITQNSQTISLFGPRGMETSKFHSKSHEIRSIRQSQRRTTRNPRDSR